LGRFKISGPLYWDYPRKSGGAAGEFEPRQAIQFVTMPIITGLAIKLSTGLGAGAAMSRPEKMCHFLPIVGKRVPTEMRT
jgi:hypothetical protein